MGNLKILIKRQECEADSEAALPSLSISDLEGKKLENTLWKYSITGGVNC